VSKAKSKSQNNVGTYTLEMCAHTEKRDQRTGVEAVGLRFFIEGNVWPANVGFVPCSDTPTRYFVNKLMVFALCEEHTKSVNIATVKEVTKDEAIIHLTYQE
jgi:hypothetical protein